MDEDFVRELFASQGDVRIRRMFGGHGIYLDGLIVAIDLGGELMLKGDEESAALFEAAGSRRWSYQRTGSKPVAMPYWSLPSEAYDDADAMALWAERTRAAALRSAARKKPELRRPGSRSRSA